MSKCSGAIKGVAGVLKVGGGIIMTIVFMAAAVAILDALVTFLNIKEREEWIVGHLWRAVWLDGLTTLAIGVSICAFVEFTWVMILPSTLGSMFGRWLAGKW